MDKKAAGAVFRFKRNETIGAAEAESDERFLADCFVDTGELDILRDCDDSRRIIVGRTGSGKSALLRKMMEGDENIIELKPENLALNYLAKEGLHKPPEHVLGIGVIA